MMAHQSKRRSSSSRPPVTYTKGMRKQNSSSYILNSSRDSVRTAPRGQGPSEFELISPLSDISNPSFSAFHRERPMSNKPTPHNKKVMLVMENVPHPDRISKQRTHVLPNHHAQENTKSKPPKVKNRFKQRLKGCFSLGANTLDKMRVQTGKAVKTTSAAVKTGAGAVTKKVQSATTHNNKNLSNDDETPAIASKQEQVKWTIDTKNNNTVGPLGNTKDTYFEALWRESNPGIPYPYTSEPTPAVALNKAFEDAVGLHRADDFFDRLATDPSPRIHRPIDAVAPMLTNEDDDDKEDYSIPNVTSEEVTSFSLMLSEISQTDPSISLMKREPRDSKEEPVSKEPEKRMARNLFRNKSATSGSSNKLVYSPETLDDSVTSIYIESDEEPKPVDESATMAGYSVEAQSVALMGELVSLASSDKESRLSEPSNSSPTSQESESIAEASSVLGGHSEKQEIQSPNEAEEIASVGSESTYKTTASSILGGHSEKQEAAQTPRGAEELVSVVSESTGVISVADRPKETDSGMSIASVSSQPSVAFGSTTSVKPSESPSDDNKRHSTGSTASEESSVSPRELLPTDPHEDGDEALQLSPESVSEASTTDLPEDNNNIRMSIESTNIISLSDPLASDLSSLQGRKLSIESETTDHSMDNKIRMSIESTSTGPSVPSNNESASDFSSIKGRKLSIESATTDHSKDNNTRMSIESSSTAPSVSLNEASASDLSSLKGRNLSIETASTASVVSLGDQPVRVSTVSETSSTVSPVDKDRKPSIETANSSLEEPLTVIENSPDREEFLEPTRIESEGAHRELEELVSIENETSSIPVRRTEFSETERNEVSISKEKYLHGKDEESKDPITKTLPILTEDLVAKHDASSKFTDDGESYSSEFMSLKATESAPSVLETIDQCPVAKFTPELDRLTQRKSTIGLVSSSTDYRKVAMSTSEREEEGGPESSTMKPTNNYLATLSPSVCSEASSVGSPIPLVSDQALSNAAFLFSPSYAGGNAKLLTRANPPREMHLSTFAISTAQSRSRLSTFSARSRPAFTIPISSAPDDMSSIRPPRSSYGYAEQQSTYSRADSHLLDEGSQRHVKFSDANECFVIREESRVAMGTPLTDVSPQIETKFSDLTDTGTLFSATNEDVGHRANLLSNQGASDQSSTDDHSVSNNAYVDSPEEVPSPRQSDLSPLYEVGADETEEEDDGVPQILNWSYREENGVLNAATPLRTNTRPAQNRNLAPTNSPMIRFQKAKTMFSKPVPRVPIRKSPPMKHAKPNRDGTVHSRVTQLNYHLRSTTQPVRKNQRRETSGENVIAPRPATLVAPLMRNPVIMSYQSSSTLGVPRESVSTTTNEDKSDTGVSTVVSDETSDFPGAPMTAPVEAEEEDVVVTLMGSPEDSDAEDDPFADILKQSPDGSKRSGTSLQSLLARDQAKSRDQQPPPRPKLSNGLVGTSLRSLVSEDPSALTFDTHKENSIAPSLGPKCLSFTDRAKVNPREQQQHAPPKDLCLSPIQRTPMQARRWRSLAAAAQEKDRFKKGSSKKQQRKGLILKERNANAMY